jgi:hypothetical protein
MAWVAGENRSTGRKTLYSVSGKWMNEYGPLVEVYWQGKTDVLGEKLFAVIGCPPQIPHGLAKDRISLFAVRGWRLTASATAQSPQVSHVMPTFKANNTYIYVCIYISFILYKNIQPVGYSSLVYTYVFHDTQRSLFVCVHVLAVTRTCSLTKSCSLGCQ